MPAIDANGITIEYESRGDGEPLLLVMGLGGQLIDWPDEFVDGLVAAGFRVITFDDRDIGLLHRVHLGGAEPGQGGAPLVGPAQGQVGIPAHRHGGRRRRAARCAGGGVRPCGRHLDRRHDRRVPRHRAPQPGRSLTSIMSHAGDRRHGQFALKLFPKLAPLGAPTTRRRSNGRWRRSGWSRARTSTSPSNACSRTRVGAQLPARGHRPSDHRHHGRPRPYGGTAAREGAHARGPRARRPARATERWRRHGHAVPGARLIMYPDMGHDLPRPRWADLTTEIRRTADLAT